MLLVNQLTGFGVGGGAGFAGARYWRLRNDGGITGGFWDLRGGNGSEGVFESTNNSGTDIAASLSTSSTLLFRLSDGSPTWFGGYKANHFASGGTMISGNASVHDLWFDFGVPRIIGSLNYRLSTNTNRQPTNMTLQWSDNNSTWNDYATLTTTHRTSPHWHNITEGASIAASPS